MKKIEKMDINIIYAHTIKLELTMAIEHLVDKINELIEVVNQSKQKVSEE